MDQQDPWKDMFHKIERINLKGAKIIKKWFGSKSDYEITMLNMELVGGELDGPQQPLDEEHGNLNDGDRQDIVDLVNLIMVEPLPGLSINRTTCDAFVGIFFDLGLLLLPSHDTRQKMDFYCPSVNITELFTELRDRQVLHRMLLLDYVARQMSQVLNTGAYEYNKTLFQTAIAKYLLNYKDVFLEFVHSETVHQSQHSMISAVLSKTKADIAAAWEVKGNGMKSNALYSETSQFGKWWAKVTEVLLAGATELDCLLASNNVRESNLNLLYGFHMTRIANNNRDDITLQAYCEQATGQLFRVFKSVEVLTPAVTKRKIKIKNVSLPPGVLVEVAALKPKRKHASVVTPPSTADKTLPAHACKRNRDVAYWVKIDPRYRSDRRWCRPGKVIGIFATGAGPATVDADVVCVVTSQPSHLEYPQPFTDALAEPVSLYLEVAVAVGVLGRVPVFMEPEVLKRFYDGEVNRELFWTEDGRVDFQDATNDINFDTAKFIGDAIYDKGRFDENGDLKIDFQNVRAVHVLVAYRTVPQSQIKGMIQNAIVYVRKNFVSLRLFSTVALCYAAALLCVMIVVWHVYALLLAERDSSASTTTVLVQSTFISMLHNTTLLASLGLVFHSLSAPLFRNTSVVLSTGVSNVIPPLAPLVCNYKAGTLVSNTMPAPFLNIPYVAWVEDVRTALFASPPPPVIVVWSMKPYHLSASAIELMHRRAVYSTFPGGVYYLNSHHEANQDESLLFSLGHQLFGSKHGYTNATHYPTLVHERLVAHNARVAVVMDNVVDVSAVRAVMVAVQNMGVVVVIAREPLLIGRAQYVEVQAHRHERATSSISVTRAARNEDIKPAGSSKTRFALAASKFTAEIQSSSADIHTATLVPVLTMPVVNADPSLPAVGSATDAHTPIATLGTKDDSLRNALDLYYQAYEIAALTDTQREKWVNSRDTIEADRRQAFLNIFGRMEL